MKTMTLAEMEKLTVRDDAKLAEVRRRLGEAVATAIRDRDGTSLERCCQVAGTYLALAGAARMAGVDGDDLEDALSAI